jgi:hypothetical protein
MNRRQEMMQEYCDQLYGGRHEEPGKEGGVPDEAH